MTNKMAAKVLTYELGSPSYGDLKLENCKKDKENSRLVIFKPGLWRTGLLDAAMNGTISSSN